MNLYPPDDDFIDLALRGMTIPKAFQKILDFEEKYKKSNRFAAWKKEHLIYNNSHKVIKMSTTLINPTNVG